VKLSKQDKPVMGSASWEREYPRSGISHISTNTNAVKTHPVDSKPKGVNTLTAPGKEQKDQRKKQLI
jgi:hypothetical protein